MIKRKAFYSFYYADDARRAAQVRNMGVIGGNRPASDNTWEAVVGGGDRAIKEWIADEMYGKSVVIVLIGARTASRRWVKYEIRQGWEAGKGVLGIHIHNLKDPLQGTSPKGTNPFESIVVNARRRTVFGLRPSAPIRLGNVVTAHNPFGLRGAYSAIQSNLSGWISEAIAIRRRYA